MTTRHNALVTIETTPGIAPLRLSLMIDRRPPYRRGADLKLTLVASGGAGGYVYSIASGSLPAGMSALDTTAGTSTGTLTTVGRYEFVAQVQDAASTIAQHRFAVEVVGVLVPVDVTPVIGEVSIPYNYTLRVSGNTGAVTWSKISGDLPAGLSLAGDGTISGTPTAAGISYLTLRATDAGTGDTLDCPVTIEIVLPPRWAIDPPPTEVGSVGKYLPPAYAGIPYVIRGAPERGIGARRMSVMVQLDDSPPAYAEIYNGSAEVNSITLDMTPWAAASPWCLEPNMTVLQVTVHDDVNGYTKTNYEISVIDQPVSDGITYGRKDGAWDALGTAAGRDVPTSGDASATQVVLGNDSRLGSGTGTVTSIDVDGGSTGLHTSGGPITSSGTITIGGKLAVENGGTGANNAADARGNLGAVGTVTASLPIVSSGGLSPDISHATSGVSAGTYSYATMTVDARGHVTAASSGAAPVTSVGATSPITSTGGATPTIAHANSGVSAGTYGYATVTVNASGHVTSISANSVGSAASYNIGTSGAVVPRLDYACTWSAAQAFGTSNAKLTLAAAYSPGSVTPASTATWYRIATLPAANLGQDAVITVGVHRDAGGGESAYRFRLFKTTWDGAQGTGVEYSSVGNYNVAYGITNARVVDGGSNQPSYLDIQLATVEAYTVRMMGESRCIGNASPVTLGWASQGTASAGMAFTVAGNWYVAGDSTQGVAHSISRYGAWRFEDAATFANGVVLPGTTSQYVRGDGSLATLPGGGSGTVTSVSAGAGMSFGTISTSGSVAMGTPSTLTASTSNSASGSTHTHAISGFLPLTGGTLTGTLTGTTIQASTIKETSDRRLKRDITALREGLAIVRALTPVRYRRACTEEHEIGLIAQDVDPVLPEVVAIGGDGTLAVGYARIVAPLIAAVQELDARLLAAEERIVALEAR